MTRNQRLKYYSRTAVANFCIIGAASPVFAEGESFEISSGLLWIAAGVVAAIAITGAMIGLTTLIGAGKQARRSGT